MKKYLIHVLVDFSQALTIISLLISFFVIIFFNSFPSASYEEIILEANRDTRIADAVQRNIK